MRSSPLHPPRLAACALFAAGLLAASLAPAATLSQAPYGTTKDGKPVTEYTLRNARGTTVKLINYGGVITAIEVPDRHGKSANIVLGFASLKDYEAYNGNIHFGALIGRYANRIAGGQFQLDGQTYKLPINNAPNTLHGGPDSFDSKVWSAKPLDGGKDGAGVELSYVSPDGENGFPGTLTVHVTYRLTDDNALHIVYEASTDKDTVVNLTNHTYFNLAGEGSGSVEDQEIRIAASRYTPTDRTSIPTGELASVEGTPLDLRKPTPIGKHLRSDFEQMVYVCARLRPQLGARRGRAEHAGLCRQRARSAQRPRADRGYHAAGTAVLLGEFAGRQRGGRLGPCLPADRCVRARGRAFPRFAESSGVSDHGAEAGADAARGNRAAFLGGGAEAIGRWRRVVRRSRIEIS